MLIAHVDLVTGLYIDNSASPTPKQRKPREHEQQTVESMKKRNQTHHAEIQ